MSLSHRRISKGLVVAAALAATAFYLVLQPAEKNEESVTGDASEPISLESPSENALEAEFVGLDSIALDTAGPDEGGMIARAGAVSTEVKPDEHKHMIGQWKGRIDPPIQEWRSMGIGSKPGEAVSFTTPDGREMTLLINRYQSFGANKGVFVGDVFGLAFAEVTLSYVNKAAAGAIRIPSEGVSWEIRNAGGGEQYFELVDLSALGACGACKPDESGL